ncbi:MAG: GTP 3',8-cyclase MoaA [Pseudomonadota bacterium]
MTFGAGLEAPAGSPRDTLGRPLRDLRISVMDRCNFRCPYCMPEDKFHRNFRFLDPGERLSFAEIVRVARAATRLGVSKLRITGGEPLLRPGLADLIAELSQLKGINDIALTTNGVLLGQQAAMLKAAGLDRITVSLDSLDPEVFATMSGGRGGVPRVLDGIETALESDLRPIKINTVVQRGVNDHTVLDLLERFRGTDVVVRFIEYMDVGNINHWQHADMVPARNLVDLIHERWPLEAVKRRHASDVASRYRYADGAGEIGFITSVTEPFCGACSRARLSSEGKLYTCLFATEGFDLRAPLRDGLDDVGLEELVAAVWRGRADRYSEQRAEGAPRGEKIEMYYIGG